MDSLLNLHEYIGKMKSIHKKLFKFLENDDNEEENYENLHKSICDKSISEDQHQLKNFLYLLIKIANNHNRSCHFFGKIEQILKIFKEKMKKFYSNWEIFKIFKDNKRILLFLIEEEIIQIDENIYQEIMKKEFKQSKYPEFFAPEIKSFIEEDMKKNQKTTNKEEDDDKDDFYKRIQNIYKEDFNQFNEKRKKGENDGLIYQIIQKDSIEDFIIYVNKENYSLNCLVERSIFETNPFLLKQKKVTLIEYAAFFGSIQIFKYLYKNEVQLTQSLWIYAIHGENEEMIHLLEENKIELNFLDVENQNDDDDDSYDEDNNNLIDVSYQRCLKESIKCHHNDIADYIIENFLNNHDYRKSLISYCFQYYNFLKMPNEMDDNEVFFYACKSDNFLIVQLLFSKQHIDLNMKVISKTYYFLNDVLFINIINNISLII